MKTLARLFLLIISLALAGTVLEAKDDNTPPGTLAMITTLPVRFSSEQVGKALEAAFNGRKWTIVESKEGVVQATLEHRGIDSRVTAVFTAGKIKYYSDTGKSKQVYDSRINKTVTVVTPLTPYGWLRNIEKDVKRQLGVLASE
ncbi:MAG: hypothetical protein SFY80_05465 [Verrucomicrobiota bacterium]|nr:hypothetical protein [Verrucomicrobiota bacterium]